MTPDDEDLTEEQIDLLRAEHEADAEGYIHAEALIGYAIIKGLQNLFRENSIKTELDELASVLNRWLLLADREHIGKFYPKIPVDLTTPDRNEADGE